MAIACITSLVFCKSASAQDQYVYTGYGVSIELPQLSSNTHLYGAGIHVSQLRSLSYEDMDLYLEYGLSAAFATGKESASASLFSSSDLGFETKIYYGYITLPVNLHYGFSSFLDKWAGCSRTTVFVGPSITYNAYNKGKNSSYGYDDASNPTTNIKGVNKFMIGFQLGLALGVGDGFYTSVSFFGNISKYIKNGSSVSGLKLSVTF